MKNTNYMSGKCRNGIVLTRTYLVSLHLTINILAGLQIRTKWRESNVLTCFS